MELGKHLSKGLWGMADKGLPVVYGLAYVLLVIRVLPEEEFGNFVLIQEVFLVISTLAMAFSLQPLLKYASESQADAPAVNTIALVLNVAFLVISSLAILASRGALAQLLRSATLEPLLVYVPVMLVASFPRNIALVLLQTRFRIQRIFWIDAVHFLGTPLLVWILSRMHLFDTALDLVYINIVSLSASSFLATILIRPLFFLTLRPKRELWRAFWDYGSYSLGSIVSYLAYSKADTFILAAFAGPVQVAVYSSAKIFTRLYEMATQIVQMFLVPGTSLLSSRGEQARLKALIEKSILFSTLAMVPVLLTLFFVAGVLISIVYSGRYPEAVGILQILALASLAVPILAIGSSVLMGLGEARVNFVLGAQTLLVSLAAFFICIPLWSTTGAAIGVVIASYTMTWLTLRRLRRFVPFTLREVLSRFRDIRSFVQSRVHLLPRSRG